MYDFLLTPEEQEFKKEVRQFVREEMPSDSGCKILPHPIWLAGIFIIGRGKRQSSCFAR